MVKFECESCGAECDTATRTVREPFEFWGGRGVHDFEVQVSDCCYAEVYEIEVSNENNEDA